MSSVENYEIDDPEVKATLRSIAAKIESALKPGWTFLLFLYELGAGKASFYISKSHRQDNIAMLKEWIARQEGQVVAGKSRLDGELNPDHPTTKTMHEQWHKVVALLLRERPGYRFVITKAMLEHFAANADATAVAAKEHADGLHIWLVDDDEARRLAQEEGAIV